MPSRRTDRGFTVSLESTSAVRESPGAGPDLIFRGLGLQFRRDLNMPVDPCCADDDADLLGEAFIVIVLRIDGVNQHPKG